MYFGTPLGEVFGFLGERWCKLNIRRDFWYNIGEVIPCSWHGDFVMHMARGCRSRSSCSTGWSGSAWGGQVFMLVYSAQPLDFVPDVVSLNAVRFPSLLK